MARGTKKFDIAGLRQLAEWLDEAGIRSIEISGPGRTLRMVMEDKTEGSVSSGAEVIALTSERVTLLAEMPGVFLTVHPSRTEPLVQPGAPVKKGDIVGLLRIGHILVPVSASCDGVLTRILVPSGSTVDFGTRLAEIESTELAPVEAPGES